MTNKPEDEAPKPEHFGDPEQTFIDLGPNQTSMADQSEADLAGQIKDIIIGKPKDVEDKSVYHQMSLVAFFAWVAVGSDLLSSSCYGPSEAFITLQGHSYLAVFLALATIATVIIISLCYSRLIEEFPSGGGGYIVASKLLGPHVGVVSGCALLVDYCLTITVSIAAAGEAIAGMFPARGFLLGIPISEVKLMGEFAAVIFLIVLNLRGVKESVIAVLPVFLLFLVMHVILIGGAVALNLNQVDDVFATVTSGVRETVNDPAFGWIGMIALLLHAYSLGAGTYTGIEAVSNTVPLLREPRVQTAKRTMVYMALSLSFMAGGLLLGYLLLNVKPPEHGTLNQALAEALMAEIGFTGLSGDAFVWITLFSEGALLILAAQAGFVDGPRILANMAHDRWVPIRFAALSERLTAHYGVLLMGISALVILSYSEGDVATLVVMYSINVFVTFSLSMIAMCVYWIRLKGRPERTNRLILFGIGTALCLFVLSVTVYSKFAEGGWHTIGVTGLCIFICYLIKRHYNRVQDRFERLNELTEELPPHGSPTAADTDPSKPTAIILVGPSYTGVGLQTLYGVMRFVPGYFQNVVFLSVGIVDSGIFKGPSAMEDLVHHTAGSLQRYVSQARNLGLPATYAMAIGTDPVSEIEQLAKETIRKYRTSVCFCGNLIFEKDAWYHRLLHNEIAYALERRLQWAGIPIIILPIRIRSRRK